MYNYIKPTADGGACRGHDHCSGGNCGGDYYGGWAGIGKSCGICETKKKNGQVCGSKDYYNIIGLQKSFTYQNFQNLITETANLSCNS